MLLLASNKINNFIGGINMIDEKTVKNEAVEIEEEIVVSIPSDDHNINSYLIWG
jgi:hypothetical protein